MSYSTPAGQVLSRRGFLRYIGAGALAGANPLWLAAQESAFGVPRAPWVRVDGAPNWEAVAYPLPLPGDIGPADGDAARLAAFTVRDELVLPEGYGFDVLARWGDRFGAPGHEIRFGYNCDYTTLIPIAGSPDDYWLVVSFEYISARPWLEGMAEVYGDSLVDGRGMIAGRSLQGLRLHADDATSNAPLAERLRQLCHRALDDLGLVALRVQRLGNGSFRVRDDARDHRRISALGSINVGENAGLIVTGPAASLIGRPPGTYSNCSGAVTPWGTALSCEENFQDQVNEFIAPSGAVLASKRRAFAANGDDTHPLPLEFRGLGDFLQPPLDGRQFGWVCELDPATGQLQKHTALGRFRHENAALRVEAGKPLVCYMGDDRRGGHIWKFVSDQPVRDPANPSNSALLAAGTLYVAAFSPDFSGEWIALRPDTLLRLPELQHMASGHVRLPARPEGGHVSVATTGSNYKELSLEQWVESVEEWCNRPITELRLGDLVEARDDSKRQAILCLDAYAMANCIGGTPTARPEDLEVHPVDQSVYIAFTDATGSADGSPDTRIFPDSRGENSRQYGAIYRLIEADNDPAATRFGWGRFVSSGEVAEGGGGFACADNLAFDPQANLWMVTDISTEQHNFPVRRDPDSAPGSSNFRGVFGNNALFMIPTAGDQAGIPRCFALGPMECELTGPTFTDDGSALILAVQHPGELWGTRGRQKNQPAAVTRAMEIADRQGKLFTQQRSVPLGSNFPGGQAGSVPRPSVVVIRQQARRDS